MAEEPDAAVGLDRFCLGFRDVMEQGRQLEQGTIVVANRYVSANMGHQGGKFATRAERQAYFEWLDRYEYGVFGIPRPDATLILHVPARLAQELVAQKAAREYARGKSHDLHEEDVLHLEAAERTYLEMCGLFDGFELIECAPDGRMFSPEAVHELIWEQVRSVLK